MSASGAGPGRLWWVINAAFLLICSFALTSCNSVASALSPTPIAPADSDIKIITILVVDKDNNEAIEGATVRVNGTSQIDNDDDGGYYVQSCIESQTISGWAPGYYINTIPCSASTPLYLVPLDSTDNSDNPNYSWMDADLRTDATRNCAGCHSGSLLPNLKEHPEWMKDGHSSVFVDPYFRNTYMGTDIYGRPSQQIQWSILEDGQKIYPTLDPMKPNYSPGYRLDYPVSNGNCALCHVPASMPGTLQEMDVGSLIAVSFGGHVNTMTEGVTCDVCHKVTDVLVNKEQMPYDDRPGILSMSIVRPLPGLQAVFGPLTYQSVQAVAAKATCYPVFSESKFCAACHYGKFANVEIYASYKEWLQSPYSQKYIRSTDGQIIRENPNYRSCQDCHMLDKEAVINTLPSERDACSETNLHFQDFNHNMMKYKTDPSDPSREIPSIVEDAAQISLEPRLEEGQVKIKVTVLNTGAGHKFPTDSPLRHLILLVEARDWRNNPLVQVGGPTIPYWAASDYAGFSGEIFANILKNKDTNLAPAFDYWNPVEPAWQGADTRLIPWISVQSEYSFTAPYDRFATITAKLIYRNVFFDVANQKGWPIMNVKVNELIVECTGFGTNPERIECHTKQP